MKHSYLNTEYVELWIENDIVYEIFKPSVKTLNLEMAKQIIQDRLKVSNSVTMPLYVDIGTMISTDKAARKCMAEGDAMKYLSATAILIDSQITKFAANVYIQFDKPSIPTKYFTNKERALQWLEQFKVSKLN